MADAEQGPPAPEDWAQQGLEHLQVAAREVIKATRTLLDAAEELVDDPRAVQDLVGTISSVVAAAAGRLRTEVDRDGSGDDDDDDGRVQRIRVS